VTLVISGHQAWPRQQFELCALQRTTNPMTTERKNSGAERKGTVGFGRHRPGRNLTLVGVCPPVTQTGPEIFFLRRHMVAEAEGFNKGREIVSQQTQRGSLTWGSLMSAIPTSSWFIMFYYLSVKIDTHQDRRFCDTDSTPPLSCTLMKNIQSKQS
jgi:hypothetical protein